MNNEKIQIIYNNNIPHGIRDENGFLLFFPEIFLWTDQEERYRKDIDEQCKLAEFLVKMLKQYQR